MNIPTWTDFSRFSQTRFVKFASTFPLYGYFILYNDAIYQYLTISIPINIQESNHSNILFLKSDERAAILFLGFLLISLFTLLFNMFCDHPIKKYKSIVNYMNEDISSITDEILFSQFVHVATSFGISIEEAMQMTPSKPEDRFYKECVKNGIDELLKNHEPNYFNIIKSKYKPKSINGFVCSVSDVINSNINSVHYDQKANLRNASIRPVQISYYMCIDKKRPGIRLLISFIKNTGLFLLFIPMIDVVLAVLRVLPNLFLTMGERLFL